MGNLHTQDRASRENFDWLFFQCQSIKKVGGRRSVEELYQALFFVSPFPLECFTERNENRAWSRGRNISENATLEIWAGFQAFYNVDRTGEYSLTVCMIGNRPGPQVWQALRRRLPQKTGSWIGLLKSIKRRKLQEIFWGCI